MAIAIMSSAHLFFVIIRAPLLFPLQAGKFDCPAPKLHPAFLLPRLFESHGVPLARNTPKRSLHERLLRLPASAERERGDGGALEWARRVLESRFCRGVCVAEEEEQGLLCKRRYGGRKGRRRATCAKDSEGNFLKRARSDSYLALVPLPHPTPHFSGPPLLPPSLLPLPSLLPHVSPPQRPCPEFHYSGLQQAMEIPDHSMATEPPHASHEGEGVAGGEEGGTMDYSRMGEAYPMTVGGGGVEGATCNGHLNGTASGGGSVSGHTCRRMQLCTMSLEQVG